MCNQDSIGELDTDRQEEMKMARRREEEEEEKGRKSALLFGSEDTFDSIASLEEKVWTLLVLHIMFFEMFVRRKAVVLLCINMYRHFLCVSSSGNYKPLNE